MTRARRELVDLSSTSYYHCINRCVRRAFLCGEDHFSGKNYEHRKYWVIERLNELAPVFAIDVCAYAIMANHYHLVLRVDAKKAEGWSEDEVIKRWQQLFKLPVLVEKYLNARTTTAEERVVHQIINEWRSRLMDLSWYMRLLNEHLARKANAEDNCTGRFWQGRFKSQALLDEAAVLTCMSYVDLNPIRAGISETLETSDFTSIQQRIYQWKNNQSESSTERHTDQEDDSPIKTITPLLPLVKAKEDGHIHAMGYSLMDYIELVDWAGRSIHPTKRGYIPDHVPPVLNRLGIDHGLFLQHMQGKHRIIKQSNAIGRLEKLQKYATQLGLKFIKGFRQTQLLYQ